MVGAALESLASACHALSQDCAASTYMAALRQGYQTLFPGSAATVGSVVESVASDISGWMPQYVQLNGVFCDLKTSTY